MCGSIPVFAEKVQYLRRYVGIPWKLFGLPGALLGTHLASEVEDEVVAGGAQPSGAAEALGVRQRMEPAGDGIDADRHPGRCQRLGHLGHGPEGGTVEEPLIAAMIPEFL